MIDISKVGKGAIIEPRKLSTHRLEAMGLASAPLDISQFPVISSVMKVKDQNGSGSCGGQAFSSYMEYLSYLRDGTYTDLSARSIYSGVFVKPEGSYASDIVNYINNTGVCLEVDVPSYDNGVPPSETFMENRSDITDAELETAKDFLGLKAVTFDATNYDSVRNAIYQGKGAIVAVRGNNACWQGADVEVPGPGQADWGHFIFLEEPVIRNGVEKIKFLTSWGKDWGDQGHGYMSKEYFESGLVSSEFTLIEAPKGEYKLLTLLISLYQNLISILKGRGK